MSDLIMELEAASEKMWIEKPIDIDRMLARRGAKGSKLTIVTFVKMETQGLSNILYMWYGMACREEGDLETLKRMMIDYLANLSDRLQGYYHMEDSYAMAIRAAVEAADVKTYVEFAQLVRALQRYFGQLAYWVDFSLPFKELSSTYAQLTAERRYSL